MFIKLQNGKYVTKYILTKFCFFSMVSLLFREFSLLRHLRERLSRHYKTKIDAYTLLS